MKHFIIVSIIIMFASKVMAHSSHYEGLKKIEMDVLRNNEVIGSKTRPELPTKVSTPKPATQARRSFAVNASNAGRSMFALSP